MSKEQQGLGVASSNKQNPCIFDKIEVSLQGKNSRRN